MGIFGWSLPPGCGTLPGEESGAYEVQIDGVYYAWDEDDNVFKQDPQHADARDDGYVHIGRCAWPEDDDAETALRAFIDNFKGE